MLGPVWLELPSLIHSYKPNTSNIRKLNTSRIVSPCNSRPMTYIYIYIYLVWDIGQVERVIPKNLAAAA